MADFELGDGDSLTSSELLWQQSKLLMVSGSSMVLSEKDGVRGKGSSRRMRERMSSLSFLHGFYG